MTEDRDKSINFQATVSGKGVDDKSLNVAAHCPGSTMRYRG